MHLNDGRLSLGTGVWEHVSSPPCAEVGDFSPVNDTHRYDSKETLDECVTVSIFIFALGNNQPNVTII